MITILPLLLTSVADTAGPVRHAAMVASQKIMSQLSAQGVKMVPPAPLTPTPTLTGTLPLPLTPTPTPTPTRGQTVAHEEWERALAAEQTVALDGWGPQDPIERIQPDLPISPHISLDLPISPYISLYLRRTPSAPRSSLRCPSYAPSRRRP